MVDQVEGLYQIVPLEPMRQTKGVRFHSLTGKMLPKIDAIDRVLHESGALSPGSVGKVERPWYMHPHQADNLMVLHGIRYVDLYTHQNGRIEHFIVAPDYIKKENKVVVEGSAMLVWPRGVFHRIVSDETLGSASVNLATHYPGFDMDYEFNIYDVDVQKGAHWIIREGHLDQP